MALILHHIHSGASPVRSALNALVLDHFDPVSIGVQDESHIVHAAVRQSLLPWNAKLLETLARCFQVIDRDTYRRAHV